MKKKQHDQKNKRKIKKQEQLEEKVEDHPSDSEEEKGFSKWLHSSEGLENLKLFVLGNSLLIFILLTWPQIRETLETAYYMYLEYTQKT